MDRHMVDVIVPVYNVSQYIGKCIDSIIHQTYISIHIFLIDDGSTDGSGGICEEYASKDNRIVTVHKKMADWFPRGAKASVNPPRIGSCLSTETTG